MLISRMSHFLLLSVGIVLSVESKNPTIERPNIIFILADDLGWNDVGFHGSEIETPHLDRLASEGVILDNYYVQPICTPTRAALLSGKYPIHTGLQHSVILGSQPYGLPLSEVTLAQRLQQAGYDTHMVGKWHLGFFKKEYLPENRGFHSHFGFYLGQEDHFDHYSIEVNFTGYDLHDNGKTAWNYAEKYSTEMYSKKAQQLINNHDKSRPLFLYLPFQAVHTGNSGSIQVPLKYVQKYGFIKDHNRRMFAGTVSALDEAVGDIYRAIQQNGMAENTVLVFSTDNGGPAFGFDGNVACNLPLRGMKHTLWEGGVRGVGFVHSPKLKMKGYVNRELIHVTDWYTTLLTAAGVDVKTPAFDDLDAIDQWDVISENRKTKRQEVLVNIDPIDKSEALIVNNYKYLSGQLGHRDDWYNCTFPEDGIIKDEKNYGKFLTGNQNNYFASLSSSRSQFNTTIKSQSDILSQLVQLIKQANIESGRQKFNGQSKHLLFKSKAEDQGQVSATEQRKVIVNCGPKPQNASTNCNPKRASCLYNLSEDPCEYNNIADQFPHIVRTFQERLQEIKTTMVPPGNKPNDPRGDPQLHGGVWQPWL